MNAGFKVFGEHGYRKASIEQIVKEAGISKGSLFYYFGSKKNFYLYLYDYCADQMKQTIDAPGEDGMPAYMQKTDFFERLEAVQVLKSKHAKKYPHAFTFMKSVVFESSPDVSDVIQEYNENILNERITAFYYNLDNYKFKEGIDPKMVMQLLAWCAEGCANRFLALQRTIDFRGQMGQKEHTKKAKQTWQMDQINKAKQAEQMDQINKAKQTGQMDQINKAKQVGRSEYGFEDMVDEYNAYVSLIRNNFYKEEYL